jgi:2,4-dienoyl-CoA reductase-like NADH-dependent reductase (Old Yellow Enzyme family)
MARYDNLFQPIQVGPVAIPNRIVRSAHGTLLHGEALIAYHEARARGGVGMSTMEATSVHAGAPSRLPLWSDEVLPFYEEISRRVHGHGMKLFQQIYHPGASAPGVGALGAPWSVGETPNPMLGVTPMAMNQGMIDEVVAAFGAAARRVRDGGLDGIDIHASSGYLIHEFLSPALNRREDGYGGSPERRLRFLLEVIAAVRATVGQDIAVGVRLPNDDFVPGGLTPEHNAAIARAVEPLVDYISLHMGSYWRFHKLIAPTDDPLGAEMDANRPITAVISKPRIVVGRIMTLDHASAIVARGEGDMVSMVRALIADPELVNKARRLEEHTIRPCIGTNIGCVGQLMSRGVLSCVVNIAAAREDKVSFEPQDRAARPRRMLVVGGGPAGLEAARTLALRGHDVELHEATSRLGGQVALAAAAPHRADVGQITRWLESEIETLGVKVRLNSLVDADVVGALAPDEVIVATGASPRRDGFQLARPAEPIAGHDLPHVHDSWALFGVGARPRIEGAAVVFDDTGSFEAISAADVLLAAGVPVTLVSRLEKMGESLPYPPVTVAAARERLMAGQFDFIGGHYLRAITPGEVEIGVLHTDRVRRLPARTVVLVGFNAPNRELADALAAQGRAVHLIGDVLGGNGIMTAIHGAAELGRSL